MPHATNAGWIASVLGRPVTPGAPMRTPDDLIARRAFWPLEAFETELPAQVAELREGVLLRRDADFELRAEIALPRGEPPFPLVLYLHGGWFCMWSAAHVRKIALALAARGHVVCNLDYRLAPEHPFPAQIEDAVYAARWLVRHAEELGGDPERLVIGGDSVGATLTAASLVTLLERRPEVDAFDLDEVEAGACAALLLYGVLDYPLLLHEPGSNAGIVELAGNLAYLGSDFLRHQRHPLVSPVFAESLGRFPPCYLSCGDEDSLLPQTLSMAHALTRANVPTTVSVVAGVDHAFPLAQQPPPQTLLELERMLDWVAARSGALAPEA